VRPTQSGQMPFQRVRLERCARLRPLLPRFPDPTRGFPRPPPWPTVPRAPVTLIRSPTKLTKQRSFSLLAHRHRPTPAPLRQVLTKPRRSTAHQLLLPCVPALSWTVPSPSGPHRAMVQGTPLLDCFPRCQGASMPTAASGRGPTPSTPSQAPSRLSTAPRANRRAPRPPVRAVATSALLQSAVAGSRS
jgi:hypothetical protein